jgi:putative DNA-invertase from lambdoid prophage Rac
VTLLEELQTVVSLGEGIDCTTPAGKLQLHILAALAKFERARIVERVKAGLARVRASGKRLGRPRHEIRRSDLERTAHLSLRSAARLLGIPPAVLRRARQMLRAVLAG